MTIMDRAIKRTLQNEYRRQTQKRAMASRKPARAAVAGGSSAVSVAGQTFPASGVTVPPGASVAVRNIGRLANAVYVPDRASSVVYSYGGGGGGGGGTGGPVPSPHDLDSTHHNGTLSWVKVNKAGSDLADLAARSHADLQGITPNQHHNQQHSIVGADHTATGLTVGQTLRATGATTFAWAQLQHNDLGGVTANQHHNQQHDIVGSDHTVTASQYQLVGAVGANALGLLTPSFNPGAAVAILRTDSNGSIQLGSTLLVVDNLNDRVGINRTPSNAALDVIVSANADHTQRLKQKSGQTGRLWRIEDVDGNELIVLDSQGNLQSGRPGFVSGLTGWQITPTGTAEFNNVWVRGELHATVFVKDEIHATSGSVLIATAGKMYNDANINSSVTDTVDLEVQTSLGTSVLQVQTSLGTSNLQVQAILNYIDIEDPPSGPGFYFQRGDVVRAKTEVPTGVTDFWLEIVNAVQMDGFSRYSVIKRSGTNGTLPAGAAMVSYGQPGDGRILLTSDLNYAPYIDVFTIGPNVWSGAAGSIIPHVRIGRLDGVGVTAVSGIKQFGIIAGTDLSDANSPYAVLSNVQLRLHRVPYTANDGTNDTVEITATGNMTLGSNIGVTEGKSFQVISGGADAGDVIIGRMAGNYLRWDQSAAILTVNGALSVGGSTVATVTYVNDEIVLVDNAASEYADAAQLAAQGYTDGRETLIRSDLGTDIASAQSAAQAYASARRVAGVSGTFGVTDHDTISWSGVSIRFGDGVTKSVTSNAALDLTSARIYLYVNSTAAAPLTLTPTASIDDITADRALIAVVDRGTALPAGTGKASINIVAGSTYISGDNILTGSIVAANVKAGTLTANEIATSVFTTVNNTALGYANNAQSAAATYTDTVNSYRAIGVNGNFASPDDNTITWASASVRKANGATVTLADGGTGNMTERTWLYITSSATSPATVAMQTNINSIPANAIIIGVAEPASVSTGKASLVLLPGRTMITGDQIITGTIVAANISSGAITTDKILANAVTAEKISVVNLAAFGVATGSLTVSGALTVGVTGSIRSTGKSFNNSVAGFFLGYDSTAYKFEVRGSTDSDRIQFDGTTLTIASTNPINLSSGTGGPVMTFSESGGTSNLVWNHPRLTVTASEFEATSGYFQGIETNSLIINGTGFRVVSGVPPTSMTAPGVAGDWRWDGTGIYVCVAPNQWRKATLGAF